MLVIWYVYTVIKAHSSSSYSLGPAVQDSVSVTALLMRTLAFNRFDDLFHSVRLAKNSCDVLGLLDLRHHLCN